MSSWNNALSRCEICGKARFNGKNRVNHTKCSKLKQQVYGQIRGLVDTRSMTIAEAQGIAEANRAGS